MTKITTTLLVTVLAVGFFNHKAYAESRFSPENCLLYSKLAKTMVEVRQMGIPRDAALANTTNEVTAAIIEDVYNIPQWKLNVPQASTQFAQLVLDACLK